MAALLDMQEAFARWVSTGQATGVDSLVDGGTICSTSRLAVYRNHFLISLGDALAATFPVVRRLLGDVCFQAAARRFIQASPPRSPCLSEYGDSFPAFLAQLPENRSIAYVADVARLEWALNISGQSEEAQPVSLERLAVLDPMDLAGAQLTLQPFVELIASDYPVDRIWRANQSDGAPPCVDLGAGKSHLLVLRQGGETGWIRLSRADFAFASAVAEGLPVELAAQRAGEESAEFNLAAAFGLLLQHSLVVDFVFQK